MFTVRYTMQDIMTWMIYSKYFDFTNENLLDKLLEIQKIKENKSLRILQRTHNPFWWFQSTINNRNEEEITENKLKISDLFEWNLIKDKETDKIYQYVFNKNNCYFCLQNIDDTMMINYIDEDNAHEYEFYSANNDISFHLFNNLNYDISFKLLIKKIDKNNEENLEDIIYFNLEDIENWKINFKKYNNTDYKFYLKPFSWYFDKNNKKLYLDDKIKVEWLGIDKILTIQFIGYTVNYVIKDWDYWFQLSKELINHETNNKFIDENLVQSFKRFIILAE